MSFALRARDREELVAAANEGSIDLRRRYLVPCDDPDFENRRERPGERALIYDLRRTDCRDNLLPRITIDMIHDLLDPRVDPTPGNAYDGDWFLMTNLAPALCRLLDPDHPNFFVIDEYYKPIATKVGRLLKKSDSVERKPFDGSTYLYRYTDDELIVQRDRDRREAEAASEAVRDQSLQLRLRAQQLGVHVIEQGVYFGIRAEELEKLLALAEKGTSA